MKRWAFILLMSAAAVSLVAQSEEGAPGKGVARLSVMNGEVSVRRGDSGELIAAAINAPLVVTDRLLTGPASRAELQFDWANMLRIGSHAEVRLGELEARRYQIQIAIGTTTFRVLRDSNVEVEISTPSVSVRPMGRGVYRVTVLEDGSSEITVRAGEADIFTPRGSERLTAGSTMLARGSVSDPEFQVVEAVPVDDWDHWNEERDRTLERSRSYDYVSSDIYGAEDLDDHGRWVNADSNGPVWVPTVAPGWAPYQLGRWSWVDYYGWTWVSYDPWGWAPYHYGRWFNSPVYGWCWWPGARHDHYYWSPGLVAFFGWGGHGGYHAGVGFGYGNIGWVPLAPHERYNPWYGPGGRAMGSSIIVNNTNITNVYRNSRAANGITAVSSEAFGRRAVGRGDLVRVNSSQLQNAGLVRGALPLTPSRESLRLADRSAQTPAFSRAVESRTFFSRGGVANSQRTSMQGVTQRISGNGSTVGASGGQGTAGSGSWRRVGSQAGQGATTIHDDSVHRFGDPGPHNAAGGTVPTGSRPSADSGWQRFGDPNSAVGRGSSNPATNRGYRAPMNSAPSIERQAPAVRDTDGQPSRSGASSRQQYAPSGADSYGGYRGYQASQAPSRPSGSRSYESQQPVRISPSIVRERPPSYTPSGGGMNRGGGGGGSYSAPAPSRPSYGGGGGMSRGGGSSPSSSAPSSHSGGGGSGASHSGGGGGGGRGHGR